MLQIVEYEADQGGYRPQIRYEGEANTGLGKVGSGGRNAGGRTDGYDYSDRSSRNQLERGGSGGQAEVGIQGGTRGYNYDEQSDGGQNLGK